MERRRKNPPNASLYATHLQSFPNRFRLILIYFLFFFLKDTREIHPFHILLATSSTAALCMNLRHSRRRMSQAVLGRWIVYFCCWGCGHWPPIPQSPNLHCNEERAYQFCFFFLPSVVGVVCVRIFQVSTHYTTRYCWELRKMKAKSNEKCIKWI